MSWRIFSIILAASLLIAAYFIYKTNYFGAALFVLMPLVLVINYIEQPKKFACRITEDALIINSTVYPIKTLEYFSVTENIFIIKPQKKSAVYVPINRKDKDEIRNTMSQYVKEREHEESLSELINRIFRIH